MVYVWIASLIRRLSHGLSCIWSFGSLSSGFSSLSYYAVEIGFPIGLQLVISCSCLAQRPGWRFPVQGCLWRSQRILWIIILIVLLNFTYYFMQCILLINRIGLRQLQSSIIGLNNIPLLLILSVIVFQFGNALLDLLLKSWVRSALLGWLFHEVIQVFLTHAFFNIDSSLIHFGDASTTDVQIQVRLAIKSYGSRLQSWFPWRQRSMALKYGVIMCIRHCCTRSDCHCLIYLKFSCLF